MVAGLRIGAVFGELCSKYDRRTDAGTSEQKGVGEESGSDEEVSPSFRVPRH